LILDLFTDEALEQYLKENPAIDDSTAAYDISYMDPHAFNYKPNGKGY